MKSFACLLLMTATLDARGMTRNQWKQRIQATSPTFASAVETTLSTTRQSTQRRYVTRQTNTATSQNNKTTTTNKSSSTNNNKNNKNRQSKKSQDTVDFTVTVEKDTNVYLVPSLSEDTKFDKGRRPKPEDCEEGDDCRPPKPEDCEKGEDCRPPKPEDCEAGEDCRPPKPEDCESTDEHCGHNHDEEDVYVVLDPVNSEMMEFNEFSAHQNKHYRTSDEYTKRFQIWKEADKLIKDFDSTHKDIYLSHNKFSDLSEDEMQAYLGRSASQTKALGNFWSKVVEKDVFLDKAVQRIEETIREFEECTQNATTNKCECAEGTYLRWGVCRPCPKGCATCNRRGKCTSCWSDNMELKRRKCKCPNAPMTEDYRDCDESCPTSTVFNPKRQRCINCKDSKCLTCSKRPWKCESCGFGYTLNNKKRCECVEGGELNGECKPCSEVFVGGFWNGTECEAPQCGDNCEVCPLGGSSCDTCASTFENVDGVCSCPSGKEVSGSVCVDLNTTCGANCVTCDTTGTCTECASNFEQSTSDTGNCQAITCGTNCATCDSTTQCLTCNENYILDSADASQCVIDSTTGCTLVGPVGNPTTCVTPFSSAVVYDSYATGIANVDWRDRYVVADVLDQGSCGSCYAFSTIGAAESAYAIKTGQLYNLSEQHVVDCDTVSHGCNGGWQKAASSFLVTDGTILESDYPYIDADADCTASSVSNRVFNLVDDGYTSISKSKASLMDAIRIQPINISFNVQGNDFWYYRSGVLTGDSCSNGYYDLNHAMIAVGFGFDDASQKDYAIVRNSWGTSWGDNGYIKVELTDDSSGVCGLYHENTVTLV